MQVTGHRIQEEGYRLVSGCSAVEDIFLSEEAFSVRVTCRGQLATASCSSLGRSVNTFGTSSNNLEAEEESEEVKK